MSHFMHHKFIAPNFWGTFHSAQISASFDQKSNGTNHFGSVRPEYLGQPLKVVHFDQSTHFSRSDRKSFPFDRIVVPSTAPSLYPACSGNNKQTRGGLERICETGMNRSIGHVEFSKFLTKIFVEWKAPRHWGAFFNQPLPGPFSAPRFLAEKYW